MASRKKTKKARGKAVKAAIAVGTVTRAIKKIAKKVAGRKPKARAASSGALDARRSPVDAKPTRAVAKKTAKKRASRRTPLAAAPASRTPRRNSPSSGGEELAEGSVSPSFSLLDQDSQLLSSSSLAGRPYVLYFYPKDDTPGCTKEACDFRDSLARFGSRGIRVIGVSPDAVNSHARFRDKYGLNFTLLSDPDKELAQAYGVWVMKQNYGREYMGVSRSTFLVDGDGVVRRVWRGVRVPGHIDQVLERAQELS
jgi:thioredoxin-dependent peroxiredoxin